jgi:hypothetical protein
VTTYLFQVSCQDIDDLNVRQRARNDNQWVTIFWIFGPRYAVMGYTRVFLKVCFSLYMWDESALSQTCSSTMTRITSKLVLLLATARHTVTSIEPSALIYTRPPLRFAYRSRANSGKNGIYARGNERAKFYIPNRVAFSRFDHGVLCSGIVTFIPLNRDELR